MHRTSANCPGELVDADALLPLLVEAAPVVMASLLVLGTHEDDQAAVDVGVNLGKRPRLVAVTETD